MGEFGGGIPYQDVLGQFLFGKRLDRGLDGQLVFVQGKVHSGILLHSGILPFNLTG